MSKLNSRTRECIVVGRTETIQILRDTWGVPHIYADTELGAIYGQGYAMAEDRLPTMLQEYRKAVGRMAEVFGPDWVAHDYEQRVWKHEESALAHYGEMSPFYQEAGKAFVAGVKRYMQEHPEAVPEWAIEPQPHHLLALGRYGAWPWILEQAWSDLYGPWYWELEEYPKLESLEFPHPRDGSNEWAVMGRRTADGHVITLLDPHVEWSNDQLPWECHLHGGDLHVYGFQWPGMPYIMIGHNERISWTITALGADTADVYELTLNPDNPLQYRYDGAWRDLKRETIAIKVKTPTGMETVEWELLSSHHGPIVRVRDDKAYAFKIAYADFLVDHLEPYGQLNKARNLGDFLQFLSLRAAIPMNWMYGDVYGNIYYQRTGRVPIRPEGYDWTRPVPGDTSKSEWLGFHDTADLVQVLNPPAGWMQNCNISPEAMTENCPMTGDRYPGYLFYTHLDGRWDKKDGSNTRGRRANELLSTTDKMTLEDAVAIANDTYVHSEKLWREALFAAYQKKAGIYPHLGEAVDILRSWNGYADKECVGMTLFREWWRTLRSQYPQVTEKALQENKPLSGEIQDALLGSLDGAVKQLCQWFGHIGVPWGEVYRARRGGESWPVSGLAGCEFVTLRLVSYWEPDENGIYYVRSGQVCTTVVMLKEGDVRSHSVVPYGQSEHPESPHFTDQGRLLFSEGKLKDTWFLRERLEGHIESQKTLNMTWESLEL